MMVSRNGLLANSNWVYQQATEAKLFDGAGSRKPSQRQIQALTDILNAIGWNSGLRKPTRLHNADAWWNDHQITVTSVFQQLSQTFQTDEDIGRLFQSARASSQGNALPCKAHPGDNAHQYQKHSKQPYRVWCSKGDCQHKLQRAALIKWIAHLVDTGLIQKESLGLGDSDSAR
jgi:hypothetical protein